MKILKYFWFRIKYVYYKKICDFFNYIYYVKIVYFWHKLYLRKNEFHKSLDFNIKIYDLLNDKERENYMIDLVNRRNIANNRNLK